MVGEDSERPLWLTPASARLIWVEADRLSRRESRLVE